MPTFPWILAALALAGCAPRTALPRPTPPPPTLAPPPLPPAANHSPDAPPQPVSVYLPPERGGGSPYCLEPDSADLRRILTSPPPGEDTLLNAAALRADIPYLHMLLRKTYAAYPELSQHRSFDINAFFAEWESRVADVEGSVAIRPGLVDPLITLKRVHRDNHLQLRGWGGKMSNTPELAVTEFMADANVAKPRECTSVGEADVFAHTIRTATRIESGGSPIPVLVASVQGVAPEELTMKCGETRHTLSPRPRSANGLDRSAPVYGWASHGDTAIITVRRLSGSPEDVKLMEQIAADYPKHRKHRRIIFDFRGNPGGNDGHIYAWVQRAFRGSFTIRPSLEVRAGAAPCGFWNYRVASQVAYGVADTPESIAERDTIRADWPTHVPAVEHRLFAGVLHAESNSPYNGKVYVLVDRHSGSSGESGPQALALSVGATLVGERTGGFLEYGNLRSFVLPHTGVVVNVPSKRNYHDPPVEGVGLPVDVYLQPNDVTRPAEELIPLIVGYEKRLGAR